MRKIRIFKKVFLEMNYWQGEALLQLHVSK